MRSSTTPTASRPATWRPRSTGTARSSTTSSPATIARRSIPLMDVPPYAAAEVEVVRLPGGGPEHDRVAVEEPLEIRIGGAPVAVTMRTPGHDEELALGFCLSEGLRPEGARVPDDLAANTVDVDAGGFDPTRLQRSFYTSSSCGVCGTGALEAVAVEARRVESRLRLCADVVALRLRPGRLGERLHGDVADRLTGVLLVGGASARFGSPKAFAVVDGETLAERAWRVLGEACDERIAVGKGDEELPFPVLADGVE